MKMMAMPVVRKLTHKGLQSRFARNSPIASRPVAFATMVTSSAGRMRPKSAKLGLA